MDSLGIQRVPSLRESTESQKPVPPLVEQDWKPHLPPPPNISPMKLDMSSIGHYSPTFSKPLLHQPPPWPGVGIVNPSVTPSSPQPYYLSMREQEARDREMKTAERKERREKKDKRKSSSSREHGEKERKSREDDRSRRRHKHHHRSHEYSESNLSREDRKEVSLNSRRHDDHRHHYHRESRDDDHRRREKERERDRSDSRYTSTRRNHRHYHDDTSRRTYSSKRSSFAHRYPSPGYPTSYTHPVYQPMLPQVVERSRFQENFSVVS
ncbi:hypothetical protein L218DRAFT_402360 [Marasmius fiardii PR-910]|nr:hypothetical protein L218DRAFT_402360 [Marasmius fiardii PR-910]